MERERERAKTSWNRKKRKNKRIFSMLGSCNTKGKGKNIPEIFFRLNCLSG
jgi:hypothetical protein